jgi:hypothetical protein
MVVEGDILLGALAARLLRAAEELGELRVPRPLRGHFVLFGLAC